MVFENVFDGAIAIGAEPLRAGTRGVESIHSMDPTQSHQPQAGAIALLGMGSLRQETRDESPRGRPALVRPRDQPGRGPFRMRAMGPRHVLGLRDKMPATAQARMRGDTSTAEEDFDGRLSRARVDALVDQLIRHAIEVVRHLHVVVDVDADRAAIPPVRTGRAATA